MAEAGIDISSQTSDHVDDFLEIDFDYVITLCDNARERCPIFSGKAKMTHKPFDDPTFVVGNTDEIMRAFRRARDQIREFVETLPESLADDE